MTNKLKELKDYFVTQIELHDYVTERNPERETENRMILLGRILAYTEIIHVIEFMEKQDEKN